MRRGNGEMVGIYGEEEIEERRKGESCGLVCRCEKMGERERERKIFGG